MQALCATGAPAAASGSEAVVVPASTLASEAGASAGGEAAASFALDEVAGGEAGGAEGP